MSLGYPKNLYILPFDHRSSFIKAFIGDIKNLDNKQKKLVSSYKKIIFEGFLMALGYVKNPIDCAVMVDEDYGLEIINLAKKKNITFCLPVEKSGQKNFDFQYSNYDRHIEDIEPDIVKALLRYNPADKSNQMQLKKLKQLDNWCKKNDYKFMLESLIPATLGQLKRVNNNQEKYDLKIRPDLTVRMVNELHIAGIEPDIWKIEAFETATDWHEVVETIRDGGKRAEVAIIMLGRGESFAKVKTWINEAPRHLLNGFAVGRTIFLRPLRDFHQRIISSKQTVTEIAKNYIELIRYWEK